MSITRFQGGETGFRRFDNLKLLSPFFLPKNNCNGLGLHGDQIHSSVLSNTAPNEWENLW